jgi:hypothetical protein
MTPNSDSNINLAVTFTPSRLAETLRTFERFLGTPLSFRSSTGEVVCKTDYFFGPCSLIRGTERGRLRCRRTYRNIEDRLLRRKTPFVNVCYAGFLIFAVPIELRGEMIGTLLGSQILPTHDIKPSELESFFGHTAAALGLKDIDGFYKSFSKVRGMRPDFERVSFLDLLAKIGDAFTRIAFTEATWPIIYRDLARDLKAWGP